ncbi:MAG: epoxyqueuosine reductase QueH [Erysipelotrichaceae bacterium]|jgi:predicted adenine nucleotide alpha hydrolase (AANH) superfamily ATPase|nr:epoxyqueuosine reductase QueH [Erysipelotrichaceae bacterium]
MNKINYDKIAQATLKKIRQEGIKPALLLHVCCAGCDCAVLEELYSDFAITLYYDNPNIWPQGEYDKRLAEVKRHLAAFNKEHNTGIGLLVADYDYKQYERDVAGYIQDKEGGARCQRCYQLRLKRSFELAKKRGFDYVCTVMTISRQKDSQILNQLAQACQSKYNQVEYFYSDFKKRDGQLRRNALVEKYAIYVQSYCGCKPSYQNRKLPEGE